MPRPSNKDRNRKSKGKRAWEKEFPALNRNAAGIDVNNAEHHVAVPVGRDPQPERKFGSSPRISIACRNG